MEKLFKASAVFGMLSVSIWALSGIYLSWKTNNAQTTVAQIQQQAQQQGAAFGKIVQELKALNNKDVEAVFAKYAGGAK